MPGRAFTSGCLSCKQSEYLTMYIPNFQDVLLAHRQIRPYLNPTPLYSYPALNDLIGTQVYVKHENYQPAGAYNLRGRVNLVSQMSAEERPCGLIAASRSSHGQSVAYRRCLFGVPARIVVPEGANPRQVAAMQG